MSSEEKITPDDLLDAMAAADVLEVFTHLPEPARREFEEWIGKARDSESHWRRIDALVMAMRSGLLNEPGRYQSDDHGGRSWVRTVSLEDGPDSAPAEREPLPLDDLVVALRGSHTLRVLGITSDDLELARSDMNLLETLRITHELLVALKESDTLDTFLELPNVDRSNFLRWIAATDGRELHQARTRTFIKAMKESPLARADKER